MSNYAPAELTEYKYFRIHVGTGTRALSAYYGRTITEFNKKMAQWNSMMPNQWKYEVATVDAIIAHNSTQLSK